MSEFYFREVEGLGEGAAVTQANGRKRQESFI